MWFEFILRNYHHFIFYRRLKLGFPSVKTCAEFKVINSLEWKRSHRNVYDDDVRGIVGKIRSTLRHTQIFTTASDRVNIIS